MTAISLSLPHGVSGLKNSDFTVGTLTPNAGDFEVRLNNLDTNSKTISRLDMIIALKMFIRALEQGGATVDVVALSGTVTPPPPQV